MNATYTTIIEDSSNAFWLVRETGDPRLAHVYFGVRVKRSRGSFVPVAKPREMLVRKECTRVVAQIGG